MATISENLQTIKNSMNAIKQAIIDKGGEISGNITTWADAIMAISTTPSTITFTIKGSEYQAEEGMTWGEWVISVYNEGPYGTGTQEPDGYPIIHIGLKKNIKLDSVPVYDTDEIIDAAAYTY